MMKSPPAQGKAALSEQRMAELWAGGQDMTSDQAIANVLDEEQRA